MANPVMEMTSSPSVVYLTPQFDDFLFARINEDSEATPLSVLSVLARLGVDPWEEAAKLAQSIAPPIRRQKTRRVHCSDTRRTAGLSKR